ncbi:MAG: hypothetical protein WD398_15380 [Cyclobacteriaceae bacterium]
MDLEAHYQKLHQNALEEIRMNGFSYDSGLEDESDSRRGLTLLLQPKDAIISNFNRFILDLTAVEPGQYAYPSSDIHITIMPIISCYEGFTLDTVGRNPYIHLIDKALKGMKKIKVRFQGVFASTSCLMIKGYPINGELETCRKKLREIFSQSKVPQSLDKRYRLVTAHSTVFRFKQPVKHPDNILSLLGQYENHYFGDQEFDQAKFVFNDWYQRKEKVIPLKTFDLHEQKGEFPDLPE